MSPVHSSRDERVDVAVIGGGIIGLSVAWQAAREGMRVALLERGALVRETSRIAAGMLAPTCEALPTEPQVLRLGREGALRYPQFIAELGEESGGDPGYRRSGTLVVARDADEAEALEREIALRSELSLPLRRLRASEARKLEPTLAPSLRLGFEAAEDHAVDPRMLATCLIKACTHRDVRLCEQSGPAEVVVRNDVVVGARTRERKFEAATVVIAAGAWSGAIGGLPDHARVPIHPVKGQILRLHDPAGPGLLKHVLRMADGYVVPRGDGRLVLGATVEERGFDTTVTAGAVFELLRNAIEVLPGLAECVLDELSAGLRPATPDNAPAIGRGTLEGLSWATGHYRHGILMAPITAEMVVRDLVGGTAHELAADFAPTRFDREEIHRGPRRPAQGIAVKA